MGEASGLRRVEWMKWSGGREGSWKLGREEEEEEAKRLGGDPRSVAESAVLAEVLAADLAVLSLG